MRELERAREAGEAVTGSISVISGSPVPSAMPVTSPSPAPVSSAPASVQAPGSAHTPTRRELRALREASAPAPADPVPLRAPKPEHERDLSEALSHVADIENGRATTPVPPREAPRTSAPSPAAPASDDDSDGDDVETAADAGLPMPVSAGRDSAPIAAEAPSAEAPSNDSVSGVRASTADDAEPAPGPRRHGAAPKLDEADAGVAERIASSTPAPSSTPTVFPFSLGSAPTPEAEPAAGNTGEVRSADPAPATAAPAAAAPAAAAPAAAAPAPAAAAPSAPRQPQIPASVPEPSGYVPPTGHWSTQADLDDDTVESVGAHFGSITSTGQHNALIIGNDQLPDVTGALNATGEVIITGSIDLPRSLAATGSHHAQRIDGSDIDRMLEEGDREQPDSDATPVRASRAVSANTSTRAVVLTAGKPKTNRLPIIAGIFGGAVILVIVGLVIAGFATHVL
ncbi:hypothetical protein GCM10022256_24180 [Frondihabitans peucedani]|uniref:Uncharacterized protein n=1 Tax=Frondihabitans peucedani TaxID=598626 RepID=A0ABP8E3M0_9MICO